MSVTEPRQAKPGVQSVERAIELLELIGANGGEAGLSDLAERSGLPMPTVHRLMQTLVKCGFARQTTGRRYGLGIRLVPLGRAATVGLGTRAEPFLARLRDATGETSNFALLDQGEIVYLAQAPSRHSMRMFTEVGRRVLAHCTAVGKALLAELDDDEVRQLIGPRGMPAFTEHTITDIDELLDQLAVIRSTGYAVDEGEQEIGVRCIAVPVASSPAMSAISISGPAGRLTVDTEQAAVPIMLGIAEELRDGLQGGDDRA